MKASSKQGNAKIHGMEDVVPSTICYAAIHVCAGHLNPHIHLTFLTF